MIIEDKTIESITPYPDNPRNNNTAIEEVATSIAQYGFNQPIVVDDNGVIVVGHTRFYAAMQLGLLNVPVLTASHLTQLQCRAYRLADNKTNEFASWDDTLLKIELDGIGDFETYYTGFSSSELAELFGDEVSEGLTDEDAVPDCPDSPISKQGDVFQLGRHRLMCGDSTELDNVKTLMDNTKADLIFTDPPYGMAYGGGRAQGEHSYSKSGGVFVKAHGMIIGDDLKGDDLLEMITTSLANAVELAKEGLAAYVCFTWRTYAEFNKALSAVNLKPKACIVWDKKSIGLGRSHYRPQHEFIFYCGGQWFGDKSQSDVWTMSRGATAEYVHPTQKPVELIEKALLNSSKAGDIIHDCFAGSGSTLIACEKTARACYAMELDPKYTDVIIQRWQDFTGAQAVKVGTDNG